MGYLIAFIVGWCGTYWPRRFGPIGGGSGGGGVDPGDPWPPNCPMCGAIIGGFGALIFEAAVGARIGETFFEDTALWFFVGAFASSLVGGLLALGGRGRANVRPNA
jgi:hypothetical protein